jgi:hypothetical protein
VLARPGERDPLYAAVGNIKQPSWKTV